MDDKKQRMEAVLLKSKFPKEAAQVPRDDLTKRESEILDKCIAQEELTTVEIKILKRVLNQYRNYIDQYEDVADGVDKAAKIIKTEQDLLNILDNPENKKLRVNLPFGGETYELNFNVAPLTDSRAVQNLQLQIDLFSDLSEKEKMIYSKGSTGKGMNREEQLVYEKLVKRVTEKAQVSQDEMVNKLLSSQLTLEGSDADIDTRLEFWKKFPFTVKMLTFMRVQDILGLSEVDQEALFRTD